MSALLATPWPDVPDLLLPALGETFRLVGVVMLVVVLLGGPLGLLIFNTSPLGLFPNRAVHVSISWVSNLGRSLPFLVLMAALIPVTNRRRELSGAAISGPSNCESSMKG